MSNQFKVGDTVVVVNEDGSPSKLFTRPCVIRSLVHYNNPKSVTIACPTKPDTALSAYRTHTWVRCMPLELGGWLFPDVL